MELVLSKVKPISEAVVTGQSTTKPKGLRVVLEYQLP
jgi:hypothetical protein